jgi:penicillin-binding protein 1A
MRNNKPIEVEVITKESAFEPNNHRQKFQQSNNPKISLKSKIIRVGKIILPILGVAIIALICILSIKVFVDYNNSPNIKDRINNELNKEASIILDRNGEVIYDYKLDAKKEKIELAQIPKVVQHALIVREQERFYKDPNGVPWYNLGGAILNCVKNTATRNGDGCRGGSGLFQQIVKNTTGNDDQSVSRKYNELLQTVKASQDLNKDDVLEIYFNNITFGRNSTGIQSGSKLFFGKGINEVGDKAIKPYQACFLASMPNLPDSYTTAVNNKLQKPEIISKSETKTWTYLKKVIDDCLNKLSDTVLIDGQNPILTKEEATKYKAVPFEEYGFLEQGAIASNNKYPFLLEYIEEELETKFGNYFPNQSSLRNQLLNGGYTIRSTFDTKLQKKLEDTVEASKWRVTQGGVNMFGSVVLDTKSSEVIAMMGNFDSSKTNTVTGQFGYFHPGSSTKPYYYASAFNNGFNPATVMPDVKFTDPYIQKLRTNAIVNRNDGPVSMRYGLQSSLNTIAEETLYLSQTNTGSYGSSEGPLNAVNYSKQLGLKFAANEAECQATVLVAIGSCNVSTISHANAMATLLNNGQYNEARPIIEIKKKDTVIISKGDINNIYKTSVLATDAAIARQTANVISDYDTRRAGILANTAGNFELSGWGGENAVAAKSGTAQVDIGGINKVGDLSAVGGTPYYTALAWTGKINDQKGSTTHGLGDSGTTIVPIWKNIMTAMHEGKTPKGFSKEGLTATRVEVKTGLLPLDNSSNTKEELLTPRQISILNSAKGVSYTDKDNIFKTRTAVTSSVSKNDFDETITCYIPHALFPDREEFVVQRNNLAGFLSSLCGAKTTSSIGQDVITSNINENSLFSKDSIIIQAKAQVNENVSIEPKKITSISMLIKGGKEYSSTTETTPLTFPITTVENGKYNILVTVTNSAGEKTNKLYKNVEFKKIVPTTPTTPKDPNKPDNQQPTDPINQPTKPITVPVPTDPTNNQ